MPLSDRPHSSHLRELAADQDDVVSREQLLALGFSQGEIAAQVEAGRWRRPNEAVIVLHNGPLTRDQREWAALLSAPAPTALCGLTAARRGGLTGFDTDVVHVLVQRGARLLPLPGVAVKVHESRRFTAADIFVLNMPFRVSIERALIDAAAWSRSPREAARIVVAGVQQRLTTARSLLDELERAGRVRHCRLMELLLADLLGGAQALSEVEFLRFCRRHGLPRPELNRRNDSTGRTRYLDAVFTLPDGRRVRVEIDGGVHLSLTQRWLDTSRDNDLVIAGRAALRFPSVAIYANDAGAVRQLRQALGLVSA
ncbi:MAG: hypothetical protein QOJ03_476 [Frankiaceae bacterium]|jgi:hypothetical protein|nr:hypothetical protein [Frankiaceae bacterium]